jgi:D-alanine-D-alanine ligase
MNTTSLGKRFGKVAVLMGGLSAEREVSLNSGKAVLKALLSQGVDAHGIDADRKTINVLQEQQFDRVFIALHGRWGEDGTIQGALDSIGLPYTGSGVMACALAMDKIMTKRIWQSQGLPTAKFAVIEQEDQLLDVQSQFDFPVYLKAAKEGSSVGVHNDLNDQG